MKAMAIIIWIFLPSSLARVDTTCCVSSSPALELCFTSTPTFLCSDGTNHHCGSPTAKTPGVVQTVGVNQNSELFSLMFAFEGPESKWNQKFEHMRFHMISTTEWCVQCPSVQLNYLKKQPTSLLSAFQGKQNKLMLLIADRLQTNRVFAYK